MITSTTRSPDAAFHEMVRRYDELYAEWDRLYDAAAPKDPDENDLHYQAVKREAEALGIRISVTEVHTLKAQRAKERVIQNEGFQNDDIIRAMLRVEDARLAKRRKPDAGEQRAAT